MIKLKYITIIFCILQLISIQLKADKFQVESFTKDEKDISARKAEVKDINDDFCAIIKVRTNVDGILFKTYPDITKIEYKTNPKEIWLYVSPGIKLITMSATGFVTQEYVIPNNIKIESLNVYVMVVNGVYDFTGVNTNDLGYFKVTSNPSGAMITMEGNPAFKEFTPYDGVAKNQEWPIGKKRIFVDLKDYYQKDTIFLIEKDKVNELNINLVPITGSLSITASNNDAIGADIYIDDKFIGNIPLNNFVIKQGDYKLKVSKHGFISFVQNIKIIGNQENSFPVLLDNLVNIKFTSNPLGASVYVDNKFFGTTPFERKLSLGSHNITLEKNGYTKLVKKVTVDESTKTFDYQLTPDALLVANKNLRTNNIMRYSSVALFGTAIVYSGYKGYRIYDNYQKYKVATDQATQLHKDIIKSRNILFASSSVAVLSGISYFIFNNKYKLSKTRIKHLSFIPIDQGICFSIHINL